MIDVIHWQTKIEQARKDDKEALHDTLDQLLKNQQRIMGALVQDQHNIGVVMVTLQRLLEKRQGDQKELKFFEVSVQNLQGVSGKHVDIQPWTITALEVEFEERIGGGGLYVIYPLHKFSFALRCFQSGEVYRGRWNKTEVALKVMLNAENTPPNSEVRRQRIGFIPSRRLILYPRYLATKSRWAGSPMVCSTLSSTTPIFVVVVNLKAPPHPSLVTSFQSFLCSALSCNSSEFLGANILDSRPFIVMPFIKNGNAQEYILRHPECNRLELVSIFPLDQPLSSIRSLILTSSAQAYHISLGLMHLHVHKVIHGDLKAVNVLIDDGPKALLSDFGLSKIKANSNSKLTKADTVPQGSLCWMAPEIFQGKRMKTSCDMYALAMTIFEVVSSLSSFH